MSENPTVHIQSIIFDKGLYTEMKARQWLKDHDFKFKNKIHTTDKFLRFRQLSPLKDNVQYRVKYIDDGIYFILMFS